MQFTFNKTHFIWFLLLLSTETAIALFLKGGFIRHTFGDFLVVILLYCFFKSFLSIKPLHVGIGVLLIAFVIEFLQLFNLLGHLNLNHSTTAKVILGSTFHISDLLAYTLGIITVLIIEYKLKSHGSN